MGVWSNSTHKRNCRNRMAKQAGRQKREGSTGEYEGTAGYLKLRKKET